MSVVIGGLLAIVVIISLMAILSPQPKKKPKSDKGKEALLKLRDALNSLEDNSK